MTSDFLDFTARLRDCFFSENRVIPGASGETGDPQSTIRNADAGLRNSPPWKGKDFNSLALELFALQFAANAPYRQFCQARQVAPQQLAHWTQIPAVPTVAFKEWELSCLPVEQRTTVFHSSGTTGQRPSRHFHSAESLAIYESSLLSWFRAHLLPDIQWPMANGQSNKAPGQVAALPIGDWPLAVLTPPPAQVLHSSLVYMLDRIRREWGSPESVFVGTVGGDGAWVLNMDALLGVLRKACDRKQPLVLLGTAFAFVHMLNHLAQEDLRFALPAGSRAMETGGYKNRSRYLPKTELHALITKRLEIPPTHIVSEYGMSELSSQGYDSTIPGSKFRIPNPERLFHFPPWARARIISPETGAEVGEGETGLIRVFDLANVRSVLAVQTEDLGIRHGDGFELVGRAALAEPRGCSLMTANGF